MQACNQVHGWKPMSLDSFVWTLVLVRIEAIITWKATKVIFTIASLEPKRQYKQVQTIENKSAESLTSHVDVTTTGSRLLTPTTTAAAFTTTLGCTSSLATELASSSLSPLKNMPKNISPSGVKVKKLLRPPSKCMYSCTNYIYNVYIHMYIHMIQISNFYMHEWKLYQTARLSKLWVSITILGFNDCLIYGSTVISITYIYWYNIYIYMYISTVYVYAVVVNASQCWIHTKTKDFPPPTALLGQLPAQ